MLKDLTCLVAHSISCLRFKKAYQRFINIKDLKEVQQEKLFDILTRNTACEYGRKYNFGSISSVSEFQNQVPITTYEAYSEAIARIKKGQKNVLTCEDVLLLEPTSGSVAASKYIPYTKSLKEEFQKGIKPWIYNLYQSCGELKWGKSYWSVTPATVQQEPTTGEIPVGFEEDSEYLGYLDQKLMDLVFAVPGSVAKEKSMDLFYYKTALGLLKCQSLTLISIWNPTFLLLLLDYMQKNRAVLAAAIAKIDSSRGREINTLISEGRFDKIWRQLKVISCWCDANAKDYVKNLRDYFPQVTIQPKGLLATEGLVSVPLWGENGARLSLYSHFFEFLALQDGSLCLAHELKLGQKYSVIITTSGGLYRYRMNDIVEVTAFSGIFPLLKYQGKQDRVSDLFGEKLNELFVKATIEKLDLKPEFYMIAPENDGYVLYIKGEQTPLNLDNMLRENFHYDYCRKLGQLKEVKFFRLTGNPAAEYIKECMRRGQRLGDIKPTALALQGGWDKIFRGEYL